MHPLWRRPVVLLALLGALAGCGGSGDDDSNVDATASYLQVVHAIGDAPPVDVYRDNSAIFLNVTPGTIRTSLTPSGDYTVALRIAGSSPQDPPAISEPVTIADGKLYTLVAAGSVQAGTVEGFGTSLDRIDPGSGRAGVQVIHASPSAGNVDVYITAPNAGLPNQPTLPDVPYQGAAYLSNQVAGSYRVRITPAGQPGNILIDSGPFSLDGQTILTAIALDTSSSTVLRTTVFEFNQ